ncbi:MAG: serine acetyltransferase [Clostridia bacterium]|nr:serine acetyltransferase [Clostridia bacterium]
MSEKASIKQKMMRYLFEAGYKYITWYRITNKLYYKGKAALPLFVLARARLKHLGYKYSFDISYKAKIGHGFQIAHYGYVVVPSSTVIGNHCRMRPGVVIGKRDITDNTSGGSVIGSYVEFGVGAKVMGPVTIGDNVIIGANAVVTHDIPSNSVVAGIPAKVIRPLSPEELDYLHKA